MEAVCVYVRPEEYVNDLKKVAEHWASFRGAALACGDEVVHVDVYLGQGVHPQLGGVCVH